MTLHLAGRLSRYFPEPFSRAWRTGIVTAALGAALLSGCGSGGANPHVSATPDSSSMTPVTGSPPPASVTVTDRGKGETLRLRPGEVLRIVLASTYWRFHGSPDTAVLHPVGTPEIRPKPSGCVPGGGCGTVTATYRAGAAGRAQVVATRTSCGEAMGCTAASGRYVLYVIVA
ncbi:MAG TPA: hypothetical protein VKB62_04040 [Streptosporangiaceae bacterium]|nr:hypothetical protein [Streptosporangiaceae bacterium]